MALTNYRAYKWIIFLLDEAPDQKFGMTLEEINNCYRMQMDRVVNTSILTNSRLRKGVLSPDTIEKERKPFNEDNKKTDKDYSKKDYISYKTLLNWRNAIWKEFGLIIWHPEVNGVAKNSYILQNGELLDENKTLRETIIHLAEDEQRGYVSKSPFSATNRGRKKRIQPSTDTSMGFVSVGNTGVDYYNPNFGYQEIDTPEMVGITQFAMAIGEALAIKYSKISTPNNPHKGQKFVLEPQQLKYINGRWYVVGNLYEYGDKETSQVVIYDVKRIQLCEDEDLNVPTYTIKEDFDIYNLLPSDWTEHFDPYKVVSLYLKTTGSFLDDTPFCSTQEKLDLNVGMLHNLYKVYVKPNVDFYIQYMAYGDELRVVDLSDKVEATPTDISPDQIKYLKDLRKRGL